MARSTLIVFASDLLVRGFVASPPDRQDDTGRPTNALFALTRALTRALGSRTPDCALALIDAELDTSAMPALLKPQVEPLGALLETHGLPVIRAPEPIQLVASYAQAALDARHEVVVLASDKRLAQLVSDKLWWHDAYKDVRYTPELVRKRFEVGPDKVAGWLALVGDDGAMPGIKGIGKKGATGLIESYGSVAEALTKADEIQGRTGKALRASLKEAEHELGRGTLDRQRALPKPLDTLGYEPPDAEAVNTCYRKMGFYSLLEASEETAAPEVVIAQDEASAQAALAALTDAPAALHALIDGPSPVRGKLAGIALSQGDGKATYFPFKGRGTCLAPSVLAAWLADPSRPKVGHQLKDAVVALAHHDITLAGVAGDSGCASHLEDPAGMAPHELQSVAKKRLHRALPDDRAVLGVGRRRKRWAQIDIAKAAAHAGLLADAAAGLWQSFAPSVNADLLREYLTLSETLVRMEQRGIACDGDDLAQAGSDFETIEQELQGQIYELAGKSFNIGSTKQLGHVLYEDLGLPIVKRTKTGWSTANEALERIEHAHPIVALVMRWRLLRRLRDSWVTALQNAIGPDGRIHATFHPARSFSGNLVVSNPDLSRVPGRSPEMARIRHAFEAPEGWLLLSVDYEQLGLYVLAHLTQDPALVDPLKRRDDMHALTAAAVLERPRQELTKAERQIGKVVNFATFAGQGASALALQLGVDAKEAKLLITRFFDRYAITRDWMDQQLQLATERGYVETITGRHWRVAGLSSLDSQARSYAERMARRGAHQGSVADVTRRALLRSDQALRAAGLRSVPLLQVLDEVIFEVPEDELAEAARITSEAMRHAFDLEVPLRVSCKAGRRWSELKPVEL